MPLLDQKTIEKYREISEKLTDSRLLSELRSLFDRRYSLTELLAWLHSRVQWSKGEIVRHNDPLKIVAYGKGRCGEFSILFTALCLAHNYRARLILDMTDHVWTEVWSKNTKKWVHVDPSEKKINDPLMYERDWKKKPREIYAFEDGRVEDVSKKYKIAKE